MLVPGDGGRRPPAFHRLTVAAVEPLCDDAVAVTFDVPAELADDYAFTAGQSLTLRRGVDGVEEQRRSYSICAPGGRRRRGSGSARSRTACSPSWLVRDVAARHADRGADTDRRLRRRPGRRRPPPVHRRRVRDHPGAVDRANGPGGTPTHAGDAGLRQPAHRHGDVRRGAGRPQGPLRPAASSWSTCSRREPATSSCSPAASTPTGCAGCSTSVVPAAGSTTSGCAGRSAMVEDARDRARRARRAAETRCTSSCSTSTSRRPGSRRAAPAVERPRPAR